MKKIVVTVAEHHDKKLKGYMTEDIIFTCDLEKRAISVIMELITPIVRDVLRHADFFGDRK